MASLIEDFNSFVALDLDSGSNPQPWPTVPAGGLSMHHVSGEVRIRTEAVTRNRHPTPLDTLDQRVSIEYRAFDAGELEFGGPAARFVTDAATWYNIACNGVIIGVEKYVAGTYDETFATSFTNYVTHAVSVGDRLELRVSGTDPVLLQVYHNDVLVAALGTSGTITDAAGNRIVTGNYVGLFGYSETTNQTFAMDNFAAEDEGAGENFSLTVDSASLAVQGQSITFANLAVIDSADLALNPFDVQLLFDEAYVLPVSPDSLTLEGQEIPFILATDNPEGELALAGQDINLFAIAILPVTQANLALSGSDISLMFGGNTSISVDSANLAFASSNINLVAVGLSDTTENIVSSLTRSLTRDLTFPLMDIGRGN